MGKQNSDLCFCKHIAAAPIYGKRWYLGARLPALSLLSLACANPVAWPAWVAGTLRGRLEKARLPHVPHLFCHRSGGAGLPCRIREAHAL